MKLLLLVNLISWNFVFNAKYIKKYKKCINKLKYKPLRRKKNICILFYLVLNKVESA